MDFINNRELIDSVNRELGDFCETFQNTRKEFLKLSRMASRTALFTFNDDTRDWAINHGGGSEIQYHIFRHDDELGYGIGFNAQYVPFHNEKSSVEYIKPYILAFLSDPDLKANLTAAGFSYIYGDDVQLRNIKDGEYILFGKILKLSHDTVGYHLSDALTAQMISDMKGVMFETYKRVFELKDSFENINVMIEDIIEVLNFKKQVILQGPPGTGKTYNAKDVAERIITGNISDDKADQKVILEDSDRFELVQFHPSYSYEDFVRGITAKAKGSQVEYVNENRIFVDFADRAMTNLKDQIKPTLEVLRRKFAESEMNGFIDHVQLSIEDNYGEHAVNETVFITEVRDDGFKYTGRRQEGGLWEAVPRTMKYTDIIEGIAQESNSRASYQAAHDISGLAIQHASYYYKMVEQFREFIGENMPEFNDEVRPPLKNYVLIIDEINRANLPSVLGELIYALEYRNQTVESMYDINGDKSIVIPENLLIIGTMNTADRSVGHIDYAIKRRFAFIDLLPTRDVIKDETAKALFDLVAVLFERTYLSPDFDRKDVQLGHSYFIADDHKDLRLKLKYEIIPILNEYVKDGLLLETAKEYIDNQIAYFVI
jgi:MoxR-like ATPase